MGAEKSTILLTNKRSTLPFTFGKGKNYLVLGSAGYKPIVNGGGSGETYPAYVMPPVHAIADELGIDRSGFTSFPVGKGCNTATGNCLYYFGYDSVNLAPGTHQYFLDELL